MGIGIYSKNLPSDYTDIVLEMLSERQLAFIITDESFCYGANYQISNVIINDDLADNHSINTILQLIGRTSRIGKSWAGKVYLDTNTKKRLLEFFDAPNIDCSNEGKNITTAFNSIIHEIDLENKKEKELLEKKEKEKELYLEKKRNDEIKKKNELELLEAKKNEEIANKINDNKNFWTNVRSNRIIDKSNVSINENKLIEEEKVNNSTTSTEDISSSWGNLRSARITSKLETTSTNLYVPKERTKINRQDIKVDNPKVNNEKKDVINNDEKNSFEEIKNYFKRR
jgi:hypothetical protein